MKFPSFSLPEQDNKIWTQEVFAKGLHVLFLYPKDMTSGCTIEAQGFRDMKKVFESLNISLWGLSKDSVKSHVKFCEKEALNFTLLSDEETKLIQALGAWQEKSMYGKKYMGTDRCTFIIQDEKIIKEWRNVKVTGHVEEVLDFCKNFA